MAVDDHGIEVLKKSGKEITPGDKSDYAIQVEIVSDIAGQLRVSGNDSTKAYLEDKVVAGNNISIQTLNEGSLETLEISADDPTLEGLSDINITNVADDDMIIYDDNTSKWINRTAHSLFHDVSSATGLISGGTLSINGGDPTKYDVAAGTGYIVDNYTDPLNPTVQQISFGPLTAVTLTTVGVDGDTIIAIDSSGNPVETDEIDFEDLRDTIILGGLVHQGGVIIDNIPSPFNHIIGPHDTALDMINAIGAINVTGNVFSANGANLNIDKSLGKIFLPGSNFTSSKKSPNISTQIAQSPVSFIYTWRDGLGGFNTAASSTLIVPEDYDDGTGGASSPNGTVVASQYTVQRIYLAVSGLVIIHYGQAVYSSLTDAKARYLTEDFSPNPELQGTLLRGFLIVRGNATDLNNTTQATFIKANRFGDSGAGANVTSATANLQNVYDNSLYPEIVLNNTLGGISITDGSTPVTGNLLEVQNNARTTDYLNVNPTDVCHGVRGVFPMGSALSTGIGFSSTNTAFGIYSTLADDPANAVLRFVTGDGKAMTFGKTGLEVFERVKARNGTLSSPDFAFQTDSNTGLYSEGSDVLSIVTGATRRIQLDASGNSKIIGTLEVSAKVKTAIKTVTNITYSISDSITSGDHTLLLDASSNAVTATLPNATTNSGVEYVIKAIDITNTVTLNTTSSQNIDGSTSYVFGTQYQTIKVQSDGTQWWVV